MAPAKKSIESWAPAYLKGRVSLAVKNNDFSKCPELEAEVQRRINNPDDTEDWSTTSSNLVYLNSLASLISQKPVSLDPIIEIPEGQQEDQISIITEEEQIFEIADSQISETFSLRNELLTSSHLSTSFKNAKELVNLYDKFSGEFRKWQTFKNNVAAYIIHSQVIEEHLKIGLLSQSMSGTAQNRWLFHVHQRKSSMAAWDEFCKEYEDPDLIQDHVEEILNGMPHIENRADHINLKKLLEDLTDYKDVVDIYQLNDRLFIGCSVSRIVSKMCEDLRWDFSESRLSLHSLHKRISDLYARSLRFANDRNHYNSAPRQPSSRPNGPRINSQRTTAPSDTSRRSIHVVQTQLSNMAIEGFTCLFCKSNAHRTADCTCTPIASRRDIVIANGLCTRCLNTHVAQQCQENVLCSLCNRSSHCTGMHGVYITHRPRAPGQSLPTSQSASSTVSNTPSANVYHYHVTPKKVFTFSAHIDGRATEVLPDTGAEVSLISRSLVDASQIKTVKPIYITGIQANTGSIIREKAKFNLQYEDISGISKSTPFEAYVADSLGPNMYIVGHDALSTFVSPESRIFDCLLGRYDFSKCSHIPRIKVNAVRKYDLSSTDPEEVNEAPVELALHREPSGRFSARLPFYSEARPQENFNRVLRRAQQLYNRLHRLGIFDAYEAKILEYPAMGHAEVAPDRTGYFIPHREVLRPGAETTQFRVVFNASFGDSVSLNQMLHQGETPGLEVISHLLRLRQYRYVVTLDLQKAFLQIVIPAEDRRYLRFLWIDRTGTIQAYQMTVLPFGVVTSPAILVAVVKNLITTLSPETRVTFESCYYMDDLLIGHNEQEHLKKAVTEGREAFFAAGFIMHKVHTNSEIISSLFEPSDTNVSLLGIRWDTSTDWLSIRSLEFDRIQTKRQLLSATGQLFDPLGFIDAFKLKLRLLFSSLPSDLDWDAALPEVVSLEANSLLADLPKLQTFQVPRYVGHNQPFYCFSDASQHAYGYSIYGGSNLLFAKSKVAPKVSPKKSIVILELQALYELTKALEQIAPGYPHSSMHLFCDSQVNLCRLDVPPNSHRYLPVSRRVVYILQVITRFKATVHHIPGSINPADIISRGCTIPELLAAKLQRIDPESILKQSGSPLPTRKICMVKSHNNSHPGLLALLNRQHSHFSFRLIAALKRWKERALKKPRSLSIIESAALVHQAAQSSVPDGTFTDEAGLIRFTTRNSSLAPIWIPKGCALARQLLERAHLDSQHCGLQMSLALLDPKIRIVNASRTMSHLISQCVHCRALRSKTVEQPPGPLHEHQLQFLRPYESIAMDVFGPYTLINGTKTYGLAVICRTTKAVKIVVLEDISAQAMILALNALWSQIGFPALIHTDNGTNFTATQKAILRLIEKGKFPAITWRFSTPLSPWQNGIAERIIRTIKHCLKLSPLRWRSYLDCSRNFSRIERIVNARPVLMSDDGPISAFQLASGRCFYPLSGPSAVSDVDALLAGQTRQFREFERLWQHQYITRLSLTRNVPKTPLAVGQHVLLKTEDRRSLWPHAKIVEIVLGSDQVCRTVLLELSDGRRFWRATRNLVLLSSRPQSETAPN